jgi:hypothetical protein
MKDRVDDLTSQRCAWCGGALSRHSLGQLRRCKVEREKDVLKHAMSLVESSERRMLEEELSR